MTVLMPIVTLECPQSFAAPHSFHGHRDRSGFVGDMLDRAQPPTVMINIREVEACGAAQDRASLM